MVRRLAEPCECIRGSGQSSAALKLYCCLSCSLTELLFDHEISMKAFMSAFSTDQARLLPIACCSVAYCTSSYTQLLTQDTGCVAAFMLVKICKILAKLPALTS